ncbi:MAG TPA: hypothetical protein VJK52_05710 [Candidatus Nanoarchaeia archaeon]|nr:hypothetical protein [Candidatus Nanoarchaeia archaeon]
MRKDTFCPTIMTLNNASTSPIERNRLRSVEKICAGMAATAALGAVIALRTYRALENDGGTVSALVAKAEAWAGDREKMDQIQALWKEAVSAYNNGDDEAVVRHLLTIRRRWIDGCQQVQTYDEFADMVAAAIETEINRLENVNKERQLTFGDFANVRQLEDMNQSIPQNLAPRLLTLQTRMATTTTLVDTGSDE